MTTEPTAQQEYTVLAFWLPTWERFAWQVEAPDPRMAEELTHQEAARRGGTLGVCGVIEGFVDTLDVYARWIDPSVHSQEQMDLIRKDNGYWFPPIESDGEEEQNHDVLPRAVAFSIAFVALVLGLLVGIIVG